MMKYGQFCPFARAAEVIGERWTPLILRELHLGSSHFNQIHRGVPRMSPTLLSKRLATLEGAGVLTRRSVGRNATEYQLTQAGRELAPVFMGLAEWGKRWMPDVIRQEEADPDLIMLDMERRIDLDALPDRRTVVRFDFIDQPRNKRYWWLIASRDGAEFCIVDPKLEIDLFVVTDGRTMTLVWYGDVPLRRALSEGSVELHGPRDLREAFPSWLRLSMLAPIPRHRARC